MDITSIGGSEMQPCGDEPGNQGANELTTSEEPSYRRNEDPNSDIEAQVSVGGASVAIRGLLQYFSVLIPQWRNQTLIEVSTGMQAMANRIAGVHWHQVIGTVAAIGTIIITSISLR